MGKQAGGGHRPLGKRAAKVSAAAARFPSPSKGQDASELLAPKAYFRERLIARLDRADVPESKRMVFVSELTGRAVQTVSRWFDDGRPGLPDLDSYLRLCVGLHCSADWMLGLSPTPNQPVLPTSGLRNQDMAWMTDLLEGLRSEFGDCDPMRMSGDEMAPKIRDGDHLFVSRGTGKIFGNGIYVVEWKNQLLVRHVECRVGKGYVLRCENPRYAECLVKDTATARRLGLRIVGKVSGILRAVHYWTP